MFAEVAANPAMFLFDTEALANFPNYFFKNIEAFGNKSTKLTFGPAPFAPSNVVLLDAR
jgi:hypothetical protein